MKRKKLRCRPQLLLAVLSIASLLGLGTACQPTRVEAPADLIFHRGSILTMNDNQQTAEAVAVKDGKILAVGNWRDIKRYRGPETQVRNLEGRALLPGFIDGHSHFSYALKVLGQANLSSPPVDSIRNVPDLIARLRAHRDRLQIPAGQWVLGWGYDPDQLEERRHPTSRELTAAFPDHPVYIIHASFHMGVANALALEKAGINAQTPDPAGGMIVREADSREPNGLVQETATLMVMDQIPAPTPEQLFQLLDLAQAYYASNGITTAQDGFTDSLSYSFLKQADAKDALYLDLEVLASFADAQAFIGKEQFGRRQNRVRLAGLKVITDGSPQGKTAFFSQPYQTEVPGCIHDCRGFPMISAEQLEQLTALCYQNGIQLYAHANGDASVDMLLDAHEKVTGQLDLPQNGQRTVVIHSQFVRPDQLEKYRTYGFIPSFFTNHAYFWGDVHRQNLGLERASFLSPMQTAADLGIIATNHTDYPVTPVDPLFLLWTSVERTSRSGQIMGDNERLTPYEALEALTINAAYQHFSEATKGSIEPGKLADFVVLDRNPLEVRPDSLRHLQVIETIKEGKVIFSKPSQK